MNRRRTKDQSALKCAKIWTWRAMQLSAKQQMAESRLEAAHQLLARAQTVSQNIEFDAFALAMSYRLEAAANKVDGAIALNRVDHPNEQGGDDHQHDIGE